jgi:hypothetical protein
VTGGAFADGEQLATEHDAIAWSEDELFKKSSKGEFDLGPHSCHQASSMWIIT